MQIIVDELLTDYQMSGKGKTVILIHGWGDSSKGFEHLRITLSKHYHVVALNLPGFGGTQMPPEPWDLTNYASFVAHFLTKVSLTPYAMIGHSNGGGLLIRGIAQKFFTPAKLVLLASAGIRGESSGRNLMLKVAVKGGKLLTSPLPQSMKRRLREKTYTAVGSDMLVVEEMQDTFKKIVADDVRHDAAVITTPTLLIYGDQDHATPPRYGQLLHNAIPGSRLETLSGAGHFVHHDKEDQVEALVMEFLA